MKKKILFVGASSVQVPPIKYAKKMGYYVISCDQNKKSLGFKYCDESYVVSTTNKKKISSSLWAFRPYNWNHHSINCGSVRSFDY